MGEGRKEVGKVWRGKEGGSEEGREGGREKRGRGEEGKRREYDKVASFSICHISIVNTDAICGLHTYHRRLPPQYRAYRHRSHTLGCSRHPALHLAAQAPGCC